MLNSWLERVRQTARKTGERITGRSVPTLHGTLRRDVPDTFDTPNVDVLQNPAELVIVADVPGASPESASVNVDQNGVLTVMAHDSEDADSGWYREFELPENFDWDAADSTVKNGVLEVHIPRRRNPTARRVMVHGS